MSDDAEKNRNDWLRAAYTEAWKQYIHEDTLSLQRSNLFIIIQTALLATTASLTAALLRVENVGWGSRSLYISYYMIGVTLVVFSLFSLALLRNWKGVTDSARAYVDLRWSTCRRIEEEVNMLDVGIGLAAKEGELKTAIKDKSKVYCPYPDSTSLRNFTLNGLGAIGWSSTESLIKLLNLLWGGLLLLGVGNIALATFLTTRSGPPPSPATTIQITAPTTITLPTERFIFNSNASPSPTIEISPTPRATPQRTNGGSN